MKKMLNGIFSILKFLLWILSFFMTLYIVVYMYQRLEKSILTSLPILFPFFLVLLFYLINIIFRQKFVQKSIFYNITSCLVFVTILFVCYRALFDTNMILNERLGYHINFNYFADFLPPMKIMLYGLCVVNILFMFSSCERTKKNVVLPTEEEKPRQEVIKAENVSSVESKRTSYPEKKKISKKKRRRH